MVRPVDRGGSLPPGVKSLLVTGRGCPAGLSARIAAGAPILIQARVSNSAGRASFRGAVQNLFTAAHKLADNDVLPALPGLLPAKSRLAAQLRDDGEVLHSEDSEGVPFENRCLTLSLPTCAQVYVHLSCGSGRKVDKDSLHQPVVRHSARYIGTVKPALVCAAEVSRWSRSGWALAPWAITVETLESELGEPVFLSFDGGAPRPYSQLVSHDLFMRASNAAQEAKDMRARTTSAIRGMLPAPDEGGFCAYPLATAPPPPLATAWRLGKDSGLHPQQVLFIDTPGVRDALAPSIVYGMPEVTDSQGRPVDQLELVRFFLAHRGRPGWGPTRLARHLAEHFFSTEGLRRQTLSRSATAHVRPGLRNDVWHIVRSLEDHLEFYRTGEFKRGIGDRRGPQLVTTLMPPDGLPYLSDEDYDRIRDLLDENQIKHTRFHRYTFGHHPVTSNGEPGVLLADHQDGQFAYRVRRTPARKDPAGPSTRPSKTTRPSRVAPLIPADLFALSIVNGLVAGHGDLTPFVAPPEPLVDETHEHVQQLRSTLAKKRRRRQQLYRDLYPEEGAHPPPTGQLRIDVEAEYEELYLEVRDLEQQIDRAAEVERRHARSQDPRGLAVRDLLAVVVSLRDPENTQFHDQWRRAMSQLRIIVESRREDGILNYDTTWSGKMVIHQGSDQRTISFNGSATRPAGRRRHGVHDAVTALRTGIAPKGSVWARPERRRQLRYALGVPPGGPMPVLSIRDPRLLRIAMAVIYPPLPKSSTTQDTTAVPRLAGPPLTPRQLPAAARRLGEPLALLKRIQATNQPAGQANGASRQWLLKEDRTIERVCRLAAERGGTLESGDFAVDSWTLLRHAAKRCDPRLFEFKYGEMTMQPCKWCGGLDRLHLAIREATEPVCGDCRKDLTGIEWHAIPYDRYAYGNHD